MKEYLKNFLRKWRQFRKINRYLQIWRKNFRLIFEIKVNNFEKLFNFMADFWLYKKLAITEDVSFRNIYAILDDKTKTTPVDSHYFYQAIWATEKIKNANPVRHIDVGSDIKWIGILSTIVPVTFIDLRPFTTDLKNLVVKKGNILNLPFKDSSLMSLSCLHVAEHIGLGRYGDQLNPEGTKDAAKELTRVLAPGGKLYFSLPIGVEKTYFNAHRVHTVKTVLNYFKDLELEELSCVTDLKEYKQNINSKILKHADFACGMFVFTKKNRST